MDKFMDEMFKELDPFLNEEDRIEYRKIYSEARDKGNFSSTQEYMAYQFVEWFISYFSEFKENYDEIHKRLENAKTKEEQFQFFTELGLTDVLDKALKMSYVEMENEKQRLRAQNPDIENKIKARVKAKFDPRFASRKPEVFGFANQDEIEAFSFMDKRARIILMINGNRALLEKFLDTKTKDEKISIYKELGLLDSLEKILKMTPAERTADEVEFIKEYLPQMERKRMEADMEITEKLANYKRNH